jgi:hypothetical protein
MNERIATYLNDHLAGARFAIELLERLRDAHADEPLGRFAGELLVNIDEDRALLQEIADQVGGEGNTFKEATAWLAEKASRLKLRLGADAELGVFEALEALSLGVLGKLALWNALKTLRDTRNSFERIDFDSLASRAIVQHAQLESLRLQLAPSALGSSCRERTKE